MDKLKHLKSERSTLRRNFTKTNNELEALLKEEKKNEVILKECMNKLEDKANRMFRLDDDIKEVLFSSADTEEKDLDTEFETVESYRDLLSGIKAKYDHFITGVGIAQAKSDGSESNYSLKSVTIPKKYLNLPKLQLNQFDGNVRNWIGFWGQYRKVHEDSQLEPDDKFQYLIQSLKPGSSARELVESFPPSGANYEKAFEQLKSRFGRDEFLIEVYIRELLNLVLQQATQSTNNTLSKLYDRLETQLRALETLGVTSNKYASMLYPLVESALPEETLRAWERQRSAKRLTSSEDQSVAITTDNLLQNLLDFLKAEVESEERLTLARTSFHRPTPAQEDNHQGKNKQKKYNVAGRPSQEHHNGLPTAATLLTSTTADNTKGNVTNCVYCSKGGHSIQDCSAFLKLTLDERKDFITKKGCCFICIKPGHAAKKCRVPVKCLFCSRKHYGIMCRDLDSRKSKNDGAATPEASSLENKSEALSNVENCSEETLLQTLLVKVSDNNGKDYLARALLDSGSQRSYITKDCVSKLGLQEISNETISHSLFGGVNVKNVTHKNYILELQNVNNSFKISVPLTDQDKICNYVPRLTDKECFSVLKDKNIVLSDVGGNVPEVKILLGADVLADLFTGALVKINNKLVAMETYLGWTIMGKHPREGNHSNSLLSLLQITDIWSLEAIGIKDPIEVKQKDHIDAEVTQHFKETLKINCENRYEVSLPWLEGRPELLDNRTAAERRLMSTTRKLQVLNKFKDYNCVFEEWLDEGVIERVPDTAVESTKVHYLPHHAVIKESSSTTKIRPVFDASAKDGRGHSLNECLAAGPNLLELIPSLVMKFRQNQIGVMADIKKAFLQISLTSEDRDFLRFLWWEDYAARKITTFRHCRVVFGVSCSPFLLAATINHHLESAPDHLQETAQKLKDSFYVDNCIASVDSVPELNKFVTESIELMGLGKFELREWASNYSGNGQTWNKQFLQAKVVPLLGMFWDREKDELFCDVRSVSMPNKKLTKRDLLSVTQRIFDVVGYTCPVSLMPKLMLQEVWMMKLSWDDTLPDDLAEKFLKWVENIHWLERSRIPRTLSSVAKVTSNTSTIHTFCDSSQLAYAACIFVRTETQGGIDVQLIHAKSRVAPKNATIPRLELLAALIGTRMYAQVKETLKLSCKAYFWSDSSIVLTWIKEKEDWGTFVGNRCKEISKTTNKEDWHHVPGELNPADLPSRGCGAKTLYETKWWEGPAWLRNHESLWPISNPNLPDASAYVERKKTVISAVTTENNEIFSNMLLYFSSYMKLLRMVAWMLRFVHNSTHQEKSKEVTLNNDEIQNAEEKVVYCIQREAYAEKPINHKNLPVFVDDKRLLRVKTRLTLSSDGEDFKCPLLMPSNHPIVSLIVMELHIIHKHAGIQTMLVLVREKFWIQKGRKTIRKVLSQCVRCKKYKAKAAEAPVAPLPLERITNCNAFRSTGIDMAGPLFLKNGEKAWVVLFTCTVYRAVHLEMVQSLSTESFISALRRFISRRGRVSVIYTDNGTNFVGTNNLLKQLDWKDITEKFEIHRITWKFNPPSAPWWGGMWERLIRILKELLRRNLCLARINSEDLVTLLCDLESTINSRPLTYVSDDYDILQPLTPSMFLTPIVRHDVQDLDVIDFNSLNKRIKYIQQLRENLRSRFKKEYLAMLVHRQKGNQVETIKVGDIVLIGDDNVKRINWPLGLVLETIPGRDGVHRVAKLKTLKGVLTRPIQRLYPMEITTRNSEENLKKTSTQNIEKVASENLKENSKENIEKISVKNIKETRKGRKIKCPEKLDL